jgi:hypothetical protein
MADYYDIPIWDNADHALRKRIVRLGALQIVENSLIQELDNIDDEMRELSLEYNERKRNLVYKRKSVQKICDQIGNQLIQEDPMECWNTESDYLPATILTTVSKTDLSDTESTASNSEWVSAT